jgi:hypothetical protein
MNVDRYRFVRRSVDHELRAKFIREGLIKPTRDLGYTPLIKTTVTRDGASYPEWVIPPCV